VRTATENKVENDVQKKYKIISYHKLKQGGIAL